MFLRMSRIPVPDLFPEGNRSLSSARQSTFARRERHYADGEWGDGVPRLAGGRRTAEVWDLGTRSEHVVGESRSIAKRLIEAARNTGGIVTAEEHSIHGGLGGAVAEIVTQTHPVKMRILGVPGVFAPTGSAEFLLEHFGLTAEGIGPAAVQLLKSR
jgi:transketolase